jgi:hypothetical protein
MSEIRRSRDRLAIDETRRGGTFVHDLHPPVSISRRDDARVMGRDAVAHEADIVVGRLAEAHGPIEADIHPRESSQRHEASWVAGHRKSLAAAAG